MTRRPTIFPLPNGPYVFKDPESMSPCSSLRNGRGEPIQNQPYVALCRCGGSKTKPFCDGTHLTNGFRSEKAKDRTSDRREAYAGKEVVVHDNRGLCAHAGHCTSGLPRVFREEEEPWIDADGATAQEILDVVRRCPSGALSASIRGAGARSEERGDPRIVVSKDGPYEVEGVIELLGEAFGEGASRDHYCLCRCGASKNKPFCDGSHWEVGFRDDKT
ncbi:MAG TPA: CDGSH iron-sulfur domain-containing protein [Planctomycetota bacterium]|nr:CDGSH iron-sulfur domain-containing protein [Planctomycetota bacterium]